MHRPRFRDERMHDRWLIHRFLHFCAPASLVPGTWYRDPGGCTSTWYLVPMYHQVHTGIIIDLIYLYVELLRVTWYLVQYQVLREPEFDPNVYSVLLWNFYYCTGLPCCYLVWYREPIIIWISCTVVVDNFPAHDKHREQHTQNSQHSLTSSFCFVDHGRRRIWGPYY